MHTLETITFLFKLSGGVTPLLISLLTFHHAWVKVRYVKLRQGDCGETLVGWLDSLLANPMTPNDPTILQVTEKTAGPPRCHTETIALSCRLLLFTIDNQDEAMPIGYTKPRP